MPRRNESQSWRSVSTRRFACPRSVINRSRSASRVVGGARAGSGRTRPRGPGTRRSRIRGCPGHRAATSRRSGAGTVRNALGQQAEARAARSALTRTRRSRRRPGCRAASGRAAHRKALCVAVASRLTNVLASRGSSSPRASQASSASSRLSWSSVGQPAKTVRPNSRLQLQTRIETVVDRTRRRRGVLEVSVEAERRQQSTWTSCWVHGATGDGSGSVGLGRAGPVVQLVTALALEEGDDLDQIRHLLGQRQQRVTRVLSGAEEGQRQHGGHRCGALEEGGDPASCGDRPAHAAELGRRRSPRSCAAASTAASFSRCRLHLRELKGLGEVVALVEVEQRPLHGRRTTRAAAAPGPVLGTARLFRGSPKIARSRNRNRPRSGLGSDPPLPARGTSPPRSRRGPAGPGRPVPGRRSSPARTGR